MVLTFVPDTVAAGATLPVIFAECAAEDARTFLVGLINPGLGK